MSRQYKGEGCSTKESYLTLLIDLTCFWKMQDSTALSRHLNQVLLHHFPYILTVSSFNLDSFDDVHLCFISWKTVCIFNEDPSLLDKKYSIFNTPSTSCVLYTLFVRYYNIVVLVRLVYTWYLLFQFKIMYFVMQ